MWRTLKRLKIVEKWNAVTILIWRISKKEKKIIEKYLFIFFKKNTRITRKRKQMQFDHKKRFTVLIRSSPNLNKHDLEDRFLTCITMETTPEKRAAKGLRNRSLSRFTLYAPLQKHFRRFRCTCVYRLQRDVELEVPFRHELVRTFTYCVYHAYAIVPVSFLCAPVFLYAAETCCCLLNSSSRRQCQGLEGNGWLECVYIHV